MFFLNLRLRPPFRTVEFNDKTAPIFIHKLINPVFIAIERRQTGINPNTYREKRIENQRGKQRLKIKH